MELSDAIDAARKQGLSDGDIYSYLKSNPDILNRDFRVQKARAANYSDEDILGHFGLIAPQSGPQGDNPGYTASPLGLVPNNSPGEIIPMPSGWIGKNFPTYAQKQQAQVQQEQTAQNDYSAGGLSSEASGNPKYWAQSAGLGVAQAFGLPHDLASLADQVGNAGLKLAGAKPIFANALPSAQDIASGMVAHNLMPFPNAQPGNSADEKIIGPFIQGGIAALPTLAFPMGEAAISGENALNAGMRAALPTAIQGGAANVVDSSLPENTPELIRIGAGVLTGTAAGVGTNLVTSGVNSAKARMGMGGLSPEQEMLDKINISGQGPAVSTSSPNVVEKYKGITDVAPLHQAIAGNVESIASTLGANSFIGRDIRTLPDAAEEVKQNAQAWLEPRTAGMAKQVGEGIENIANQLDSSSPLKLQSRTFATAGQVGKAEAAEWLKSATGGQALSDTNAWQPVMDNWGQSSIELPNLYEALNRLSSKGGSMRNMLDPLTPNLPGKILSPLESNINQGWLKDNGLDKIPEHLISFLQDLNLIPNSTTPQIDNFRPSFEDVKQFRSALGNAMGTSNIAKDISQDQLDALYSATTQDMRAKMLKDGGSTGASLFDQANAVTERNRQLQDQVVKPFIDAGENGKAQPGAVAKKFANETTVDAGNLSALREVLPQTADAIAAAHLRNIGLENPNLADSLPDKKFGQSWAQISPDAKAALLPDQSLRDQADSLAQDHLALTGKNYIRDQVISPLAKDDNVKAVENLAKGTSVDAVKLQHLRDINPDAANAVGAAYLRNIGLENPNFSTSPANKDFSKTWLQLPEQAKFALTGDDDLVSKLDANAQIHLNTLDFGKDIGKNPGISEVVKSSAIGGAIGHALSGLASPSSFDIPATIGGAVASVYPFARNALNSGIANSGLAGRIAGGQGMGWDRPGLTGGIMGTIPRLTGNALALPPPPPDTTRK